MAGNGVELVWEGKRKEVERIALPFQQVCRPPDGPSTFGRSYRILAHEPPPFDASAA